MTIDFLFWILMLLWLLFGFWLYGGENRRGLGGHGLLWILLFLLGWKVFGWPIAG